jgi:pyridoxine kinase
MSNNSTTAHSSGPRRVLAIQSHVVSGYVGNKCVVLPLNRLGFDVDAINSVQFSNHSGYPHVTGQQLTGDELEDLVDGLEKNDLLDLYTHVLTGYIGNPSMIHSICKVVKKLKEKIPGLVYMCDPVCGDNGKLYVNPELPRAFEEVLVPMATIVTPNQFEAELLTNMKIVTVEDAVRACEILHEKGPSIVVITSLSFSEEDDVITVIGSVKGENSKQYCIDIPRIDGHFLGTGDLFMSLMLGWIDRYPDNLPRAMELAVGGLQGVLHDTSEKANKALEELASVGKNAEKGDTLWWKCRELRLIDNQDKLLCPEIRQRAREINK